MRKLPVAVLMTILALGVIGIAKAQDAKRESDAEIQKAILAVDNERYEAMQKKDMAALDRLHADGLVFINTKGRMLNKAEYLEEIRSGNLKFLSVETDDYTFCVYGDTVIMSGRAKSVVEYHGVVNKKPRRFTSVFIKMQGQWRLVAHQATLIADESN
jgi:ketosteroid isomerase-like protein